MGSTSTRKTCLRDFHAYGFDLDYTIAKFNLVDQIKLSYKGIIDFLVEQKGYDESLKLNLDDHKDFLCKGLIVDVEHGNIIKLSHHGKVLRGSHGLKMLTREELVKYYGQNLQWKYYNKEEDVFKLGNQIYAFKENYFNIPELLVVAKIVELLDQENGGPLEDYHETSMISDITEAVEFNYVHTAFQDNAGFFFPGIKTNSKQYYQPCSDRLKVWLKDLKQENKCIFLITSSHLDFANLTATNVLGDDWKSYFDIIITNARKPGFFDKEMPFLSLDGYKEDKPVDVEHLKQHGVYCSGNSRHLQQFISKLTGVQKPKVIYFGDSIRSDALPTKANTDWDVGIVLEEMDAEGYQSESKLKGEPIDKKMRVAQNASLEMNEVDREYLLSKVWGSFFYQPDEDPQHNRHMNTFWGELITKYTDIAIPSIEYIASLPLDIELPCFNHEDDGNTDGFSPCRPISLEAFDD